MHAADLYFYQGYDPEFILKKAMALKTIYMYPTEFSDFSKSVNCDIEAQDAAFLGALATELHCAAFHQIEGLLALLLAEYQSRPHWVYLTSYGNFEMKNAARLITAERYEEISHGVHKTGLQFVRASVYAGWKFDGPDENKAWLESLNDIEWFIKYCAQAFLAGSEYNAYKHGLRVVSGAAALAARVAEGPLKTVISMQHSLSYLEMYETPDGYQAEEVTKELSPDHSFQILHIAAQVLSPIKECRKARALGKVDEFRALTIDRNAFMASCKVSKFSFSF